MRSTDNYNCPYCGKNWRECSEMEYLPGESQCIQCKHTFMYKKLLFNKAHNTTAMNIKPIEISSNEAVETLLIKIVNKINEMADYIYMRGL